MNYPVIQSPYLGNTYRPPQQQWPYPNSPYPAPVQNVYVQQPRQHNGDGLLTILLAVGLIFTWVDSRRQKAEVRQLREQVSRLQHQVLNQGETMNQPPTNSIPLSSASVPSATPTSFSDGTHFVGDEGIQPGIYRAVDPGMRYYVARLRNFTGQNAILANWNGVTPGIIEILPTDVGVEARGGVTWQRLSAKP